MKISCYGTARPTVGQTFYHCKRMTVPGQSLSLAEILRRYVRREPLPQSHEGTYETRFGDLEKIARMDIVDQMEIVDSLKAQIAAFESRQKAKAAADAKSAEDAKIAAAVAAAKLEVSPPDPRKPPAVGGTA